MRGIKVVRVASFPVVWTSQQRVFAARFVSDDVLSWIRALELSLSGQVLTVSAVLCLYFIGVEDGCTIYSLR